MIKEFRNENFYLSNFYERPVTFNGITYLNNEAAFQSMKVVDLEERKSFANLTASESKKKGRKVILRPDWESVKFDYMYLICKAKFSQNIDLKKKLLSTMGEELIEGTTGWHDNIWGNCECPKCKNIVGQNHLGKILMRVRDELFFEDVLENELNKAKALVDNNEIKTFVLFFANENYEKDFLMKIRIEFMREMGYYLFSKNLFNFVSTRVSNGVAIATKEYYDNYLIKDVAQNYIANVENL